jgi:hypothetical protein
MEDRGSRIGLFFAGTLFAVLGVGYVFLSRWHFFRGLGLRPGMEWIHESGHWAIVAAIGIVAIGVALCLVALRARILALLPLILAVIFAVLTVRAAATDGKREVHFLTDPSGKRAVLILRAGHSPSARLWAGAEPFDVDRPLSDSHLRCDGPISLRPSERPGRWLIVGDRNVVGALVDLNEPALLAEPKEQLDLEEIRREFGEDLRFEYPDS